MLSKLYFSAYIFSPPPSMETPSFDHEQCERAQSAHRKSRAGSAVKAALVALLGTGTVGGVGYTVHRQNELEQRNGAMEQKLTREQMLREGIQSKLEGQERETLQMQTALSREQALREGIQRRLDTQVTLDDMDDAVEMVTPATVRVEGPEGLGSGVILTDRLGRVFILTNGHVTEENEFQRGELHEFRDGVYHVVLYTGNDFREGINFDAAPAIRKDGRRAHSYSNKKDLALLRIPPEIEQQIIEGKISIPRLKICDRTAFPVRAGDRVIAVGNPFGERDHITDGIVSNGGSFGDIEPENAFIRTSAPINPGNSGGGLFRVRREGGKLITELVGINTWGYRGGDGVSGSIDIRVVALQCHEWGVPIVSDEEIDAYRRWWDEEIVPFQRNHRSMAGTEKMPPADD